MIRLKDPKAEPIEWGKSPKVGDRVTLSKSLQREFGAKELVVTGVAVGGVTEKLRKAVTKLEARVTKPKGGRPKRYETLAEKQRAYRERKKHG